MQHQTITYPETEDIKLWVRQAFLEILQDFRKEINSDQNPHFEYKTRKEIAEQYHISLVTLAKLTKSGLPSVKMGKRRLYRPIDVYNYLHKKTVK